MTDTRHDIEIAAQVKFENSQIEQGVARYQSLCAQTSLSNQTAGQALIRDNIKTLSDAFASSQEESQQQLINSNQARDANVNLKMIQQLVTSEQLAFITLKVTFDWINKGAMSKCSFGTLAKQLGESVRQQVMFEDWKQTSKLQAEIQGHNKSMAEILISRAKGQVNRMKLSRWQKKFEEYRTLEWGDDILKVGSWCVDMLLKTLPESFVMKTKLYRGKTQRFITMSDELWASINDTNELLQINQPLKLPTIIEPKDWKLENGKLTGGYYLIDEELIRSSMHKHTAGDKKAASYEFIDSVNAVQKTAWSINTWMLSVMEMISGTGQNIGDIPMMPNDLPQDCQTLPSDKYEALSKEERKAYHGKRSSALEQLDSQRGKYSAFVRKINIAHTMSRYEKFYFPHFSDFRGRLYPLTQDLTPQQDQIGRALLQFAEGKKLGQQGVKWLCIHIANTYGKDKATLTQREDWVYDNFDAIEEMIAKPLSSDLLKEAAEPLPFLAACKELIDAHAQGNPQEFVSKIAIAVDGTCNGMQLLSLIGRDPVGAEKTNCRATSKRYDLYSEVAAEVVEFCKDQMSTNDVAKSWLNKIGNNPQLARKVVKRAVMTVPYGVSAIGITAQLISDKHCDNMEDSKITAANFMKDAILHAMTKVNGKAVEIMEYLQECANRCAEQNKEISWYTPMGLKVTQAYYHMAKKQLGTVLGTITLWQADKAMTLDVSKNTLAVAPNFIHSLDAAMLQLTVSKMHSKGYTDFAMIHDSYGMHAGNMEELSSTLREAAYEIFSQDVLGEFAEYIETKYPEITFPSVPEYGDLDVTEIKKATYFFS